MIPTVSVIIPTYNRCAYVQEAIDSVLAQTYSDYEIIVIDDGSTDGTGDALRARYGDRILYMLQQNQGEAAARNQGIELASGDMLAFLDDDDIAMPSRLGSQVWRMGACSEVGLVAGGAKLIDATGTQIGEWRPWEGGKDLSLGSCILGCPLCPSLVMIRRSELDRLDHWFDPAIVRGTDTDLFLRLMVAGCRMEWMPELVSAYRQHAGSMQSDAAGYHRGGCLLYDKLFAHPHLPVDIAALKPQAYAFVHLDAASRYYECGSYDDAKAVLLKAAKQRPDAYLDGRLVEELIGLNSARIYTGLPADEYRVRVLENLPDGPKAGMIRRRVISRLAMSTVFAAAMQDDWEIVKRHWWLGVSRDPRWLANRGVWCIGIRAYVGGLLHRLRRREDT